MNLWGSGILVPCRARMCWLRLGALDLARLVGSVGRVGLGAAIVKTKGFTAWTGAGAAESSMRGFPAKLRLHTGLFLAFALTAGIGLAGCSDLDTALFG